MTTSNNNSTTTSSSSNFISSLIVMTGMIYGAWLGYPSILWMFLYAVVYGFLALMASFAILALGVAFLLLSIVLAFVIIGIPLWLFANSSWIWEKLKS